MAAVGSGASSPPLDPELVAQQESMIGIAALLALFTFIVGAMLVANHSYRKYGYRVFLNPVSFLSALGAIGIGWGTLMLLNAPGVSQQSSAAVAQQPRPSSPYEAPQRQEQFDDSHQPDGRDEPMLKDEAVFDWTEPQIDASGEVEQ